MKRLGVLGLVVFACSAAPAPVPPTAPTPQIIYVTPAPTIAPTPSPVPTVAPTPSPIPTVAPAPTPLASPFFQHIAAAIADLQVLYDAMSPGSGATHDVIMQAIQEVTDWSLAESGWYHANRTSAFEAACPPLVQYAGSVVGLGVSGAEIGAGLSSADFLDAFLTDLIAVTQVLQPEIAACAS